MPKTRMESYVEALFEVLEPDADSVKEIATKMQRRLGRDFHMTEALVHKTLHYVRKHPEECGYTVPHVKRGPLMVDDRKKFFALLIKPDGTFRFDDDYRDYLDHGALGSVLTVASMMRHLAASLDIGVQYEPSRHHRDIMEELRDEAQIFSKRAERAARKLG